MENFSISQACVECRVSPVTQLPDPWPPFEVPEPTPRDARTGGKSWPVQDAAQRARR